MNIYSKKSRKIMTAILAILLILAMVVPFLAYLV